MWNPFKKEALPEKKPYKPLALRKPKTFIHPLNATYDATQTTPKNEAHWGMATNSSPNSENSLEARKTLRTRSRYETANNSYCEGMIGTFAEWMIGTGPTLQVKSKEINANQELEGLWLEFSEYITLPEKLRILQQAKMSAGEGVGILINNPDSELDIQLDLRLLECDRVTNQNGKGLYDPLNIDGVITNKQGYVTGYEIMEEHPGESLYLGQAGLFKSSVFPAEFVLFLGNRTRPEQHRFAPQTSSALDLFQRTRDFMMATVTSAITQASLPSTIETNSAPMGEEEFDGETDDPEAMDILRLEQATSTVMPKGWGLKNQKPQYPPTNYEMFDKRMINGEARAFKMPMNIASGNSAGYNYASGRLDHQSFWRTIKTTRGDLSMQELNKLFFNFFIELAALPKYRSLTNSLLPKRTLRKIPMPVHTFMFPGLPHVDPKKEADAFAILLQNDGITLETWFGEQGKDWRTQVDQMKVEKDYMKLKGITKEEIANGQQAPE